MTLELLHRRSVLGFVLLGPLGLISGSPVLLVAGLGVMLILLRAYFVFGDDKPGLTMRVVVHGLTLLGLGAALLLFRTDRVDAVLSILLLGLANRLLLRVGQRDDFLLIAITSTMIAAATTVTPGIEFLLIVVGAVPALVLALWTSELIGSVEHDPVELSRARGRPAPSGMGRWIWAAVLMTVFGTAFCTLFPRYKFSRVLGAGALVRLPGASDAMQLDDQGVSDDADETVVMRVHPESGVGVSELQGLYARLYALEDFDGRLWSRPDVGPALRAQRQALGGNQRVRVQLLRQVRGGDHPVAVLGRDRPARVFSPHLKRDAGGSLLAGIGSDRQIEYWAALDLALTDPAPESEAFTQLPEDLDPRFAALAEGLVKGAVSDEEKVRRVLAHFETGYRYDTGPLAGAAKDPLVRFVFEAKSGHCELFAAAVATLLRSVGLRARVATGYYGGRWNRVGGYMAFVQGDAHAWVEVWSEADGGWRWVDATPEDLRGRRAGFNMWALARDWYDTVSALWYDRVVDFDGRKQRELYVEAMDRFSKLSEALRRAGGEGSADRGPLGRGLVFAAGGAAFLLFGLPGLVLARRRRSPQALGHRLRRALGAREERDRALTLGRLLERQPETLRSTAQEAVRRYEEHRFGTGEPKQRAPLLEALRALERKRRRLGRRRD